MKIISILCVLLFAQTLQASKDKGLRQFYKPSEKIVNCRQPVKPADYWSSTRPYILEYDKPIGNCESLGSLGEASMVDCRAFVYYKGFSCYQVTNMKEEGAAWVKHGKMCWGCLD